MLTPEVFAVPLEQAIDIIERLGDTTTVVEPMTITHFQSNEDSVYFGVRWSDDALWVCDNAFCVRPSEAMRDWLAANIPSATIYDYSSAYFPSAAQRRFTT